MLLSSATLKSSVGGPLTEMFILLLAILAVGIYGAWSERRGPLGWIVSIVASVVGGVLAITLGSMASEKILSLVHFQGSLASSQHPLLYILSAGMAIVTVLGSWIAIQIVNRFRQVPSIHGT